MQTLVDECVPGVTRELYCTVPDICHIFSCQHLRLNWRQQNDKYHISPAPYLIFVTFFVSTFEIKLASTKWQISRIFCTIPDIYHIFCVKIWDKIGVNKMTNITYLLCTIPDIWHIFLCQRLRFRMTNITYLLHHHRLHLHPPRPLLLGQPTYHCRHQVNTFNLRQLEILWVDT